MIHTGSVAEVQGEGKRLANNRNLLEKFSICPVYTGMSQIQAKSLVIFLNLPRIHGDEPITCFSFQEEEKSAPYTRG